MITTDRLLMQLHTFPWTKCTCKLQNVW